MKTKTDAPKELWVAIDDYGVPEFSSESEEACYNYSFQEHSSGSLASYSVKLYRLVD